MKPERTLTRYERSPHDLRVTRGAAEAWFYATYRKGIEVYVRTVKGSAAQVAVKITAAQLRKILKAVEGAK